jgi:hypothetical protein
MGSEQTVRTYEHILTAYTGFLVGWGMRRFGPSFFAGYELVGTHVGRNWWVGTRFVEFFPRLVSCPVPRS